MFDVGEAGMFMNKTMSFLFYNMAGVPSPDTKCFHLRVIDGSNEANPSNQYDGDFGGLYFSIEQPDGRFIDEHELADGKGDALGRISSASGNSGNDPENWASDTPNPGS